MFSRSPSRGQPRRNKTAYPSPLQSYARSPVASAPHAPPRFVSSSIPAQGVFSVCWAPELGLLCAVSYSGTNRILVSRDGGESWIQVAAPVNNQWVSVCWSPRLRMFAAIAQDGTTANQIMVSRTGFEWSVRSVPATKDWLNIIWAPELRKFVAHARTGTQLVLTSEDGENWTLQTSSTTAIWGLCWAPEIGKLIGVGAAGNMTVSQDSLNWRGRTFGSNWWMSVCWSPERRLAVAVAYNQTPTTNVAISRDGENWELIDSKIACWWRSVVWSPELRVFVALADGLSSTQGTLCGTSVDGKIWKQQTVPTSFKRGMVNVPRLRRVVAVTENGIALTGFAT
jgi:hypothetical protein